MPNYNQAPELKFNGEKSHDKQFYQIPQKLADIVFNELGNSSAQLRVMMVLIGTKEGFKVSEQWILDRTGLQHASYINARKALINKGWLSLEAANSITVNFNNIYKKDCSNTTLLQCSNTTLPITNKETNKETNNIGEIPEVDNKKEMIHNLFNSDGSFKM